MFEVKVAFADSFLRSLYTVDCNTETFFFNSCSVSQILGILEVQMLCLLIVKRLFFVYTFKILLFIDQ